MTPPNAGGAAEDQRGRAVLLVVGEEYAERLRKLGLLAATSADELGAGDVAVIAFRPDSSPEWHRSAREAVAAECRTRGHRTKLCDLELLREAMRAGLAGHKGGGSPSSVLSSVDAFVEALPNWEPPQMPSKRTTPRRKATRSEAGSFAMVPARSNLPALTSPRRGWIPIPRDLFDDDSLSDLSAERCFVVFTLLRLASFNESCMRHGDKVLTLPRGTLRQSVEEVAAAARVEPHIARRLIEKLLRRRWLVARSLTPTGPRLLHIPAFASYVDMVNGRTSRSGAAPRTDEGDGVPLGPPNPPPDAPGALPTDDVHRGKEMLRRSRETREREFLRLVFRNRNVVNGHGAGPS